MEIFTLYDSMVTILLLLRKTDATRAMFGGLLIATAIVLGLFILQGFGLAKMAKSRNVKRRWLAFVPFANMCYIGKLAGDCDVFGHKVKRVGLYAMLAQIVTFTLCLLTIAAQIYLFIEAGEPQYDQWDTPYWSGLSGLLLLAYKFYNISSYILSIFQLLYQILLVVLLMGLYKKYYPKNYLLLGILGLFIPLSRYVVIFVLRNRKAIDYDAYIRARREAYMRQQQQYYNTYQNPYQNPYGRYHQNPYNPPPPQQKPEEPFGEFGGKKGSENEASATDGGRGAKEENPFEGF